MEKKNRTRRSRMTNLTATHLAKLRQLGFLDSIRRPILSATRLRYNLEKTKRKGSRNSQRGRQENAGVIFPQLKEAPR